MAAFIAYTNGCEFCTRAHTDVAKRAYGDSQAVPASFSDEELSAIKEPLRATILMLGKLSRQHSLDPADVRAVLAAGASSQQIKDAFAVSFAFNVIGRLADTFGFSVPGPEAFATGAKYLLSRGYR